MSVLGWSIVLAIIVFFFVLVRNALSDSCTHCGELTYNPDHRQYTRAWNHLCSQAAGARGWWCPHCQHVNFEEPDYDKWIAKMPAWIGPYDMPWDPEA